MPNKIHVYDREKGVLYLEDGREVDVHSQHWDTLNISLRFIEVWAAQHGYTGPDDQIAVFM